MMSDKLTLTAGRFFGKGSRTLDLEGFHFTEREYSPSGPVPMHSHERAHICFVLTGSYIERIGTRSYDRKTSSLVFYPEDASHAEDHRAAGRHFLVEIAPAMVTKLRDAGAALDEPMSADKNDLAWLAARMYQEFCRADDYSGLILESMATELIATAARRAVRSTDRQAPSWLGMLKEVLGEHSHAPPRLDDLAVLAGVHPTHVARIFRRFEGCTPGEYLRALRVRKACDLLVTSDLPLADIGYELGFADQPHFARTFKREIGLTPSEYRRIFCK